MNTKSRLARLVIAVLTACCAGTHQRSLAQGNDPNQELKRLYAFDSWGGKTKIDYLNLITNWVPDFGSLGVTNFLRREEGVWTNSQKSSYYIFQSSDASGVAVDVKIFEERDVTSAHLAMLNYFTTSAAPQPFPVGSSFGVDIGDRCYLNWGVLSSVSFVRNNVIVFIRGGYPVLGLAEKLDSQLVALSFPGPVLLQAGMSDYTFHFKVATAPGKTYVLEYQDSLTGTNWGTSWFGFTGDGTIKLVTVPVGWRHQFYRLRVE